VLGEDARRRLARQRAEPRELLRRNEGETLVERLEYLAPLVEEVAPCGVVFGNAGVEDEIVISAGHGERVELDRAERAGRAAPGQAEG
jgi:N-dimethylarginine dimethylaminohydrolase